MDTFGERLKGLRKQKKLTLEKLAEYFLLSKNATSSWETGKSKPNADDLIRLAELLDTTPNYLLLGKDDMSYIILERENELLKETLAAYRKADKAEKELELAKNSTVVSK